MGKILHIHIPNQKTKYEELLILVPTITFAIVMLSYIIAESYLSTKKSSMLIDHSMVDNRKSILSEAETSP
ncbi:MAG: hypothetical protein NZM26_02550 [Patescibacteria group bacterium]|nr:hypothetical protein [Patescibacteria group bacterium]